ncbi:MAG: hypothetical protein ABEI86_12710, partial [Halobacteriaceae archaeon]
MEESSNIYYFIETILPRVSFVPNKEKWCIETYFLHQILRKYVIFGFEGEIRKLSRNVYRVSKIWVKYNAER